MASTATANQQSEDGEMAFGRQRRDDARNDKQFDNTNRGILFENDRKRGDKDPDYKGSINVDGREYWLSGWEKDTKRGPALSLSIQPKQEQRRESYERSRDAQAPARRSNDDYDDRNPPPADDWGR